MKNLLLTFCVLLCSISLFAQSDYKTLISKGDAAYDEKDYAKSAELYKAADKLEGFSSSYHAYNAACSASLAGKNGMSYKFLSKAIELGYTNKTWMEGDSDFDNLRKTGKYKKAVAQMDKAIAEFEASLKYPELRKELLNMQKEDQKYRLEAMELRKEKGNDDPAVQALWDKVRAVDYKSTQRMKEIIKEYGWPLASDVGKDGASAAWLLVQHADRQPHFQKKCLPLLEKAFKNGEARGSNYAYLYDRVALKLGKKQRFGSQARSGEFAPIENETEVNERRAQFDLGPLEDYAKNFGFEYELPDELSCAEREKEERTKAAALRKKVKAALKIEAYDKAKEAVKELTRMNGWVAPTDFIDKAVTYMNCSEPNEGAISSAVKLALVNGINADDIMENPLLIKLRDLEDWNIIEMMLKEMKQ